MRFIYSTSLLLLSPYLTYATPARLARQAQGSQMCGPDTFCQTSAGGPPRCVDIPEGCCITVPSFDFIPKVDCSGTDPATLPELEQPPVDLEGAQQKSEPVRKRSPQTVDDIKGIIVTGIKNAFDPAAAIEDQARANAIAETMEKMADAVTKHSKQGSELPI